MTIGIANGWIDLEVTTTAGCLYSVREPVTVAPAINTTLTAPTTICPSDSIDISVVPTSLATYTFFIGGAQVQESSSATLTTTGITQTSSVVIQITNSAGCIETVSTTINVIDLDDGGDITSLITTICSGASSPLISNSVSATLESYSAAATITYFWEQSYDTLSWTPIPLEVGSSLPAGALTNITSTTHFRRVAQIEDEDGDLCETLYSNTNVTITVEAAITPTITSSTGAFTFCEGVSVANFSASPAGQATYTWTYFNGTTTTSSTSGSSGTTTQVTLVNSGWIKLDISTLSGCVYSATQSFTVNPDLNVNISPDSYTICQGGGVVVTVNNPVGAYTYTYIKEGVAIAAATNITTASYTITNLNDGDIIAVEATDNSTGCTGTSSFTLNVISALSSVGSITRADTDILCSGEVPSTIFGDGTSGSASATTTTGTITYQWYYKTAAMANFAITGSDPIRDQSINYSPSALSETTTFKRLASVILNGVSCSDSFSLTEEIVVYDAEGGTLDSTSASMCFSFGDPAPTITVTGSSVGNYQWQDSSDGIVFANVPSAQLTDFTPTITATGTYYYRRVTTVGTCSDTTDVFTLTVGETDAGSLDTAPSGVYCYGTQPPQLGIGTSVNGSSGLNAVTYRWESKIDGAIGGYNEIIGETNRAYQPPPLFASPTEDTTVYLYRRVTLSLGGCESVPSNVVSITISPEIEVGYLNFQNVDPDNYFICQGQDVENLVLINATPVQAGVVTYTWQESTDLIVWTEVASSSSNSNLNFGTSNTPSVTTYYRVKITSGEGSPDSGTSVLNILLTETSETPTIGEVYSIYIEGYEARVTTTAAVSTTDTLGAALAASITSSVTGYTATYFADENIIEIDNYTTDVTISRSSSSTLFSAPILLSYDSSEDFCSAYTNVVGVTIYEEPLIQQTGGSIDSQVICLNSAIDPVTFNVTGSYDYVVITGISDVFDVTASGSGSATYSTLTGAWTISNTSAFTITGTPTLAANQSLLIQIETSGSCDEEAVFNYRIETVQSPNDPDIIYRNNPQNSRALNNRHQIFQSGGTWFNNTVAQDSDDVLPDNAPLTYEFAACYSNNQDLRYVKFDWQILPVSAVQSITYKNDNDTTMQAIITASYDSSTVTFTVGIDYVITITSPDGSTNDVTFTTVQDDITENLDDLDNDLEGLPSISSSRSGNVITLTADTPGEAGYFSIQVQNPDNAEIFINSPEYLYPEQDNAIEVIFNPDFGTQTPTITSAGVTATLRVRAESIECDDVFSDWYEVELYVVSEQNPVANFPNIREPEVLSRNYCGVNSNDTVPACEVDTESNLESTFYAAAESGEDNDYAYLEWKIDKVAPGDPSAPFPGRYFTYNNGIDPDYGTISWAPGFHGQFDVCVRAVACDGTTDTWECYSYVISPESEMPDVFALNIPVCPITANTVTSTFTSNLMVNWTITPLSAIASTSTRTVNGLDAFDVVWEEGYSGMVWLTADVKDCAGDPRYYTVRIPEDPNLTRTSTPTVQTVCQGDQILPITYSVSGYSVLGINDAELPLGLTGVYSSTVQEATIRVFQRTLSVDDSDNKYILAVDYNDYAYEADGTESLTEITEAITSMVVSSTLVGTATSTTSNNSSTIIITGATPGIRFNIASNTPETSRYTISQPVIANLNGTYTVSGSVSETLTTSSSSYRGVGPSGTSQVHEFDLTIISSSASCTTVTETVVIYYNPKGSIATATPTLLTQYICDGDSLEEIEFELSGGATDYDPVVWYPAEPNGIEFSPESGDVLGVGTSFTLSGTLNTGVTTTTVYYYTITTNGSICDTGSISGTLVVYPKEEVTQVPASNQQFCVSEYLNLEFNFEGISALVVSTTSSATFNSLGLSSSWTYTSTPSVALTVVTSATAVNEIYQIEIIDELGAIRAHQYTSVTGSESTTTIASELRASINSTNPFVTASISNTDSSVIDITADNNNYVFWTRVNVEGNAGTIEHNDGARMRVTDAIPVEGYLSITGTPTVSITETASYSLVISTPGNLCSQASVTFEFDLIPDQSISITSSPTTQNQNICDGEEIDDVTFFLEGLTTGYSFSWSNGAPNGLDFDPLSQNLFGTSTITLSGSLNTGVTTTTVYYYTLTTTGTTCAIGTVTGSIVVYPKEEILLPPNSPITYDITDFVDLEYTFEGVSSLTLTASSSADFVALGLTSSNSYTTTPSVELTIVSSPTVAQQIYSVELVQEDGSSSRYFYQVSSTTESITSITAELANLIDQNGNVIAVVSDTDSSVINISANDQDYIFWIRINEGQTAGSVAHYDEATMRITNAVPVQGVFSLTGTPTVSITETTSYTFTIVTPGIQCTTDSETTVVIINPEAQITLTSSLTTLNQELTNTSSIDSVTFLIGGDADSYTIEWPNGAPTGLSISPVSGALAGTNTLTLSGELDTATTTTTVYYYTITAFDGLEEGDSISGSVVVHPDEIISLSPPGVVSYCNSDLISLSYQFEGFRSLSVSSTSSSTIPNLGIISELTYSTTPTVLITVVASATSLNEDYQIEIVQEDGNSTAFNYQSTTATESISSIANGLAAEINATNSAVVATVTSGGSISIEAVSSSYVFWIRINQGSVAGSMENYEDSRIRVTGAIAVKGEFTVTGTPTISVTATTSYSLIVVSPGLRVGTDSTSATTIITLEPEQLISLTSSSTTLNQVLCDNTAIDDVVFQLSGNATGFTGLNWIGNIPGGILQPALGVSNTITLTGTITTGVTTTTVYVYSITTTGNSCESNTVTGSFTVNPDHYITLDVDSESDQTVCDLSAIDPIEFEISGGATGVSVDWPSGNPGLNIYLSNSSSTTYVISGTLNTSVATETIYVYTVTTIGNSCTEATLSGQITVIPQLIINVDSPLTQSQMGSNALCNGDDIQAIDFSFTSGNSPTLFLDWTDSSGVSIGSPGPALSGYSIRGPITTSSTELTTYYYTLRAVQTNGSCVFTDEFNGTLQVSPDIIVHENYIRVNDVTDVSCPLGNDGSIIIPSTPESEFQLRIEGGQTASAQIDKVALLVSDTLDGGDQISVIIDGITFTSVVASGTTTQTMLEELRDKVNFGTGSDNVAVTAVVINDGSEVYLQLTADTAGSSFVASGTTITSLVTGTTVVSTLVENENLNYEYTWTRDGALVGSTLSIENLIAGTYTLAVSINGCQASSTYSFEIQQPSISVGTISETCNGDISVPISAYLTASQLAIPGTKVTAELYELGSDNTYSELFGTQNFSTSLATNTFAANFYSLAQGEMYQLVVTDNTCSNRITQLVGPLNTFLAITENSITTTDEECFGEGGNLTLPLSAITGGSGYYSYNWTNLSTAEQYNTRNVTGAAAGLYEVTIADQNYGCEVTTVGLIEIEAVTTDISVQWSEPGPITNDCFDSRDGTLEVVVNGGSGDFFYDWYFQPSTSSVTLQLSNDSDQLVIDNAIPASYSAGGEYYVRITDGGGVSGCADSGTLTNFVVVNPEEISFATASSTISNIQCAGEETGSIYVEVAGGTGNYLYTINGGIPYLQTTGVISENNLPAGNYTLIVEDENNNCSSAQQITQAITISEPAGGPLELSLGEINEIPCDGGLGSIEIGISGGSPITTNSASTVIDFYTVTVARQGGGFILNTTHDPSNSSLQIGNLATAGTYDITVSDTNGCTQQLTNIILNNTSNGLGASGVITQASGCNNISSTDGATITVAWPDRGDGNNGGYPLWQQRIAVNLDSFIIVLNGTVAGADLSTLGVAVTTTNANTIFASSTASSSLSTVQDVAAQLAYNINQIADLTATLNGSTILVKGQLIDSATSLSASGTTLNLSVSGVSQIADSQWTNVPGMDGMEVISGLSAGYYRAIINDGSGCGGTLVQNTSQGGTIFEIDAPQSLQFDSIEFDEVTCTQPTSSLSFKLSNGVYTYSPDPSAFELTLNSVLLTSTVGGSVSFSTGTTTSTTSTSTTSSTTAASSVGSTYTPNLRTNSVEIENLIPGDYELVVKNIQTECLAVLNFTINDASSITYSGETDFDIDPCFDTYQEVFFDPFLIDGGEPFSTAAGEPFYSLRWTYTPSDLTQNTATINSVSNNVNFAPRPGTYELLILDSNGCTILDENGDETPIEFTFNQSLTSLEVSPAGGVSGDQFATPVSCEIGAEDGQISIEVDSSDPFEINWHKQESSSNVNEQRLLFQGTAASGVGSEVYSIRINDVPLFYETKVVGEPIASVVPSFAAVIDSSPLFATTVDPADPNEISISSSVGAEIKLEIVSLSTTLQMVNSSTSGASWVPLDGTSGNPNYTGYLSLNNLAEGLYRYTISAVDVTNCNNGSDPNTIQQIIAVENENILEIREGPIVDEYLCNGKSGTLFIDVFDGNTGPLTFFYNSTPVTYEIVGTNQYIINIDNPVETATLEIYNAANCGLSREINIGNGTPLFEFSSTNFEQSQTFLAREDITFTDSSENEYDSFEFIFGDGTQTELIERNSPDPILHEYAISGTYYVTLRIYNDLGCVEELTKTIKIGKGFSVLVPNVFTPNGDIWNSTFRPIFNGLSEITLRVYDAQGGLLYEEAGAEGSDPDTFGLSLRGWEGNTNLSSSPYFIYTITAKTIDDEAVFRDGTFILLQ